MVLPSMSYIESAGSAKEHHGNEISASKVLPCFGNVCFLLFSLWERLSRFRISLATEIPDGTAKFFFSLLQHFRFEDGISTELGSLERKGGKKRKNGLRKMEKVSKIPTKVLF